MHCNFLDSECNSARKHCNFFQISLLRDSICDWMKVRSSPCQFCSSSSMHASPWAVPQRPLFQKPGILFHKTWNGSIKKLLSPLTTFCKLSGNEYAFTKTHRKQQATRSSSVLYGNVFPCLHIIIPNHRRCFSSHMKFLTLGTGEAKPAPCNEKTGQPDQDI